METIPVQWDRIVLMRRHYDMAIAQAAMENAAKTLELIDDPEARGAALLLREIFGYGKRLHGLGRPTYSDQPGGTVFDPMAAPLSKGVIDGTR